MSTLTRTAWGLDSPRVEGADTWFGRAACQGANLEMFFPVTGYGAAWPAKRMCRRCPVQADCLAFALKVEGGNHPSLRFGVWGGLDPRERHQLWRCQSGHCRHPNHRPSDAASGR